MARLSRAKRSVGRTNRPSTASRAFHFILLGQALNVLKDHWQSLPAKDRARLAELVKQSKGRPMHLTPQQRTELSNIIKRADIPGLGRDLAPLAARRAVVRRGPLRRR